MTKLTVADLQQMKRDGKRIAASGAYDYQMAQILDRAGADLITVPETVGMRFFGNPTPYETTLDLMVLCSLAVSRGVRRAVVSCDLPWGTTHAGPTAAVKAAIRLVKEGRAEMVKVKDAADNPEAVRAIAKAGIPVWAFFGFTPEYIAKHGRFEKLPPERLPQIRDELVETARRMEEAGASACDCTDVGDDIVGAIAKAVRIPVIGGHNTGPNADGRVTVASPYVGYSADLLDHSLPGRPNVSRVIHDAMADWFQQVRNGTADP